MTPEHAQDRDVAACLAKATQEATGWTVDRMRCWRLDGTLDAVRRCGVRRDGPQHEQLREHVTAFVLAYLYDKRLETLKGLTPYEHFVAAWQKDSESISSRPYPLHYGTIQLCHRPTLDDLASGTFEAVLDEIKRSISTEDSTPKPSFSAQTRRSEA